MKPKSQRLFLIGAAVAALIISALLAMPALREGAAYFYAPADLAAADVEPGQPLRLGGLVEEGSVMRLPDGVTTTFRVTDRLESVPVRYSGIVPDLFREGQGVIADGRLQADGTFAAETLLAKHDENYMPPEVAEAVARAEAEAKARPAN
ncbi:cytochrome c biogenesis protein CcmE [Pacificimonas flava]|uniref:Cytochrome c-type biogenesis protein CcmE n=2 Tax=Pacificimonas TaxID=1960290 RepID=A0A219B4I1_9SPHN|nr:MULTISPECIES: cytochrome c maturation protein CcmE [Pacificimonas]MBZ6379551.1 cytochrome c maturation protein CcmE [Pacificimonas aurantium]OWV33265.1 cytochrome c biogenesis protein CcmE [Pacificimonas flava]